MKFKEKSALVTVVLSDQEILLKRDDHLHLNLRGLMASKSKDIKVIPLLSNGEDNSFHTIIIQLMDKSIKTVKFIKTDTLI